MQCASVQLWQRRRSSAAAPPVAANPAAALCTSRVPWSWSYLALNRFHGGRCPSLRFSGFAFAWLVATLRRQQQPSPGGGAARQGAGGSLWRRRLTTIFHKMEKHGPRPWGTKPTSIPLGEKTRAHRHYTTAAAQLPPWCYRPPPPRRAASSSSGRPEPKRQLETTAEMSRESWFLEHLLHYCTLSRDRIGET